MANTGASPWESQDIIISTVTMMHFGIPEAVLLKELCFNAIFQIFASTSISIGALFKELDISG